jgi:hypothetical protein
MGADSLKKARNPMETEITMQPDFSYRIEGMFALILPESPAGEKAMPELMAMTDGTAKVFASQLQALKSDLHAAGYTIRKRSVRKTCSKADIEYLFGQLQGS